MHISGISVAQVPPAGKSKDVPPGLERRGLDLPPGIAKKLEGGGSAPSGIVNRFPAATVAPADSSNDTSTDTTPSEGTVDIVV